jgi:putative oxidoreductase
MENLTNYLLLFCRVYLGAFNLASGINYFFHVWAQPIPADALGAAYMDVTLKLGLFQFAKVLEMVGGFLLVTDLFVPLALVLLFPVTVTIFIMNVFFSPMIHVVLSGARNFFFHGVLFAAYFGHYRALFRPSVTPAPVWRAGGASHG